MKATNSDQLQAYRATGASNVVRVSLPASAYFDIDATQKLQKDILGRLGCPGCTSGWDIRWDLHRRFVVDEKLNIHEGLAEVGFGR
jgi:hypothetical protein